MEILHRDRCFLVCLKPSGILSTDEPGGLPDLLRKQPGLEAAGLRTVHRLDRVVGGVMVVALTRQAASLLSEQLREDGFGKEYFAVVRGRPEPEGIWEDLLGRDPVRRVTFVAREPGRDIRPARLEYRVLEEKGGCSLVRIRLHTGRTHQIRVQFASRGFPLVGDRKYGSEGDPEPMGLWSCKLEFRHPFDRTPLTFFHRPPDEAPWNLFDPDLFRQ